MLMTLAHNAYGWCGAHPVLTAILAYLVLTTIAGSVPSKYHSAAWYGWLLAGIARLAAAVPPDVSGTFKVPGGRVIVTRDPAPAAAPSAPGGMLEAVSNAAADAGKVGVLVLALLVGAGAQACAAPGQLNAGGASVVGTVMKLWRWACGTALPVAGPIVDGAIGAAAPSASSGGAAPAASAITDQLLAPRAVPQR